MKAIKNRKANFEYDIIDDFTSGIVLTGSEVKSIREGDANISSDSFIYLKDNEIFIKNFKVARYKNSHKLEKHDENRDKKLLLNKREIIKIGKKLENKGLTCIPLKIFEKNNRIKLNIAVVKGRKTHDKRRAIKERDIDRDSKRYI